MSLLRLGVVGTSSKENESRLPIHPQHLDRIDADLREHMTVEAGYGRLFGVSDAHLSEQVGAVTSREEIFATCDIVLLPKPTLGDLKGLRDGQVLWGWPHAVQDPELTQIAIDKHLTLIAWEQMHHWTPEGELMVHVFHLNNEMAGYCSVLQAMTLIGTTGHYGRHLRAVVLGFGNTARGAVTALHGLGIHDVTALTMRDIAAVASPIPEVVMHHMHRCPDGAGIAVQTEDGEEIPVGQYLAGFDIVVNCVLQDTDHPMMFISEDDLTHLSAGHLIVDVSCDRGMGFSWARPTSFEEPMFTIGDGVAYYAVDHSPSYLWNSATWGISEALIPFLRPVMAGDWDATPTISRAIEIREGVIVNPKILSFQRRSADHPHPRIAPA